MLTLRRQISQMRMSIRQVSTLKLINSKMSIGKCLPSGKPSGQLVIILGWMGAKDQHIEKYRRLYYQRGFDVLTCKTSTYDLLVKVDAVKNNAKKLIDYLDQHILPIYSDIIVHSFSVGAYYWCELITELNKVKTKEQIENGIQKHLKGAIFDSIAYSDGVAHGYSVVLSKNPMVQRVIERLIQLHVDHLSGPYYSAAQSTLFTNNLPCNRLILSSLNDQVSLTHLNERTAKEWVKHGMMVQWKQWNNSPHVLHYYHHQQEYLHEIDKFLAGLKLNVKRGFNPIELTGTQSIGPIELQQN